LRAAQLRSEAAGMPPILMACMPRSASATLTHTLGRAIGAPVLRIGAGRFRDIFLVPSWLDMFLEGGAITQDHFPASDFNVGVLSGRDLRDVFVLVRDPRAAARSQVHFLGRDNGDGGKTPKPGAKHDEKLRASIESECVGNFIPWLQGWIDLAKRDDLPFRVHFITYREICEDLTGVVRKIAATLQDRYPTMSRFADMQTVEEVRVHFVTGNDQAWQAEIDGATRDRLWEACSADMKSLLDLQR
jgi:hypothetical protein